MNEFWRGDSNTRKSKNKQEKKSKQYTIIRSMAGQTIQNKNDTATGKDKESQGSLVSWSG